MAVLPLSFLPGLPSRNPTHTSIRAHRIPSRQLPIKLAAASKDTSCSAAGEFLSRLSVSVVLLMGVSIGSFSAFSPQALARIPPASRSSLPNSQENIETEIVEEHENLEDIEDEEMKAAFEKFKSKSYALTVPLRVVALEGSLPPIWVREFLKSQGKRVRFRPEFRRSIQDIFQELSNPFKKGKLMPKAAVAADLVTLGDSWLDFAIAKGLIDPMNGAENQDWFRDLSDKWKVYLRRSSKGNLDSQGSVWAVPYRWGSIVIAYNKKELQRRKLDPLEDWSDLWRPELSGKIAMIDEPREIIGAVLKYMGASYNTTNIDSQVAGGKHAVLEQLELLVRQVRLFDSQHYLKAFRAGDVWIAVGWSSDILPVAKTMSNVSVIVPKSGTSLWADFWAIPSTSRIDTDKFGGRVRGPSPLVQQWVDFCLQPERAAPFKEEIVPGASPFSLKATGEEPPAMRPRNGRPKLETNLVANVPPAEILAKCEFLEPLSEDAASQYLWLISSLQKPSHGIMNRLQRCISVVASPVFWRKTQAKAA